jgi:hypothetical protein
MSQRGLPWRTIIGVAVGAGAGFAYYILWGCDSG